MVKLLSGREPTRQTYLISSRRTSGAYLSVLNKLLDDPGSPEKVMQHAVRVIFLC